MRIEDALAATFVGGLLLLVLLFIAVPVDAPGERDACIGDATGCPAAECEDRQDGAR